MFYSKMMTFCLLACVPPPISGFVDDAVRDSCPSVIKLLHDTTEL